jgi:hypothetical protein
VHSAAPTSASPANSATRLAGWTASAAEHPKGM